MSRTVTVGSRTTSGPKRYHTESDCPHRQDIKTPRVVNLDDLDEDYTLCAWCSDDHPHNNGGSKAHLRSLKAAAEGESA